MKKVTLKNLTLKERKQIEIKAPMPLIDDQTLFFLSKAGRYSIKTAYHDEIIYLGHKIKYLDLCARFTILEEITKGFYSGTGTDHTK